MAVIGIDIGGTKVSAAVFTPAGEFEHRKTTSLEGKTGKDAGLTVIRQIKRLTEPGREKIDGVGVSVPGIYSEDSGTVWAPNIPGWEQYPLQEVIRSVVNSENIKVAVESDRVCYILGETWQGIARGCKNAVFVAVGTGIGIGVMVDGAVLRGSTGSAGSAGWLALDRPFNDEYRRCGCLEYHASGKGIANKARKLLGGETLNDGPLGKICPQRISARDVFDAYDKNDPVAVRVIDDCIQLWGMAAANIVSLFNPEIIVFGGGVFGPAKDLIGRIKEESVKWAQPAAVRHVKFAVTALGGDAGLTGAARYAFLALELTT